MVYSTTDELCTYLANMMDKKECETKIKNYEMQTETILDCQNDNFVEKRKGDAEIVAFMYTEDGCPYCADQRRVLGNLMDTDENFKAYDVPLTTESCNKYADDHDIQAIPRTEIYIKGKKALEYNTNVREENLRKDINGYSGI